MCRDTKQATKLKIAQALHQLMQERSVRKITVQDLMERTQMTRQSFYYHFQDIQDVLVWCCEQLLALPLQRAQELTFEEWMVQALNIVYQDRIFYRQVLEFADQGFLFRFCKELLRPRVAQMLFQAEEGESLDEHQEFVLDVIVRAVLACLPELLSSRRELDASQARARLRYLLLTMSLNGGQRPVLKEH